MTFPNELEAIYNELAARVGAAKMCKGSKKSRNQCTNREGSGVLFRRLSLTDVVSRLPLNFCVGPLYCNDDGAFFSILWESAQSKRI
jgi:hypothetical protein